MPQHLGVGPPRHFVLLSNIGRLDRRCHFLKRSSTSLSCIEQILKDVVGLQTIQKSVKQLAEFCLDGQLRSRHRLASLIPGLDTR